ncbi:hypothetical protein GCM10027176_08000 [Actinoallomurus bryophytorum]|uniref:Uncharacterized protein n=1 Tax=Actinoallomurus bryophytorum TaxID=1490222 RepID=A0A543CTR4_9ACTN|nr:hypothetical protein [Actinoallomurus bryophytorum]TQM00421.1 hypothetical protein FB559_6134 [Actinoallomurus bryophytorum]
MSVEPVPRREVVTRSPRRSRRTVAGVPLAADDGAAPGAVQLRSLMRSQLRSSLVSFAVLAVPTGVLPLVLALATPSTGWLSGPSLAWIILGFAGYPPLVLLAWWYVRRAERHEKDFARLVKGG